MSETEALEGLRRSEEKLRAYGAEHGLVLREERLPWPGPAAQQPGPVKHAVWSLAGVLPGWCDRAAPPPGRLRHHLRDGRRRPAHADDLPDPRVGRLRPLSSAAAPTRPAARDVRLGQRQPPEAVAGVRERRARSGATRSRSPRARPRTGSTSCYHPQLHRLARALDAGRFRLPSPRPGVFHRETPNWRDRGSMSGEVEPALLGTSCWRTARGSPPDPRRGARGGADHR